MNPGNPWVQAAKISAVTTFDADKKHVTYLLQQIEQRDLALPDFQRDFVWKPGETRELVRSVMQSFPAGTILLMQGGAKHFKPRSFAQAPDLSGKEPTYLALDGQQRLTSLSLAFSGRGGRSGGSPRPQAAWLKSSATRKRRCLARPPTLARDVHFRRDPQ